ncbi:MAG: polysaccharide biosynthesis tyrosine autokinase [Planctomycetes bacterium]|nr:polysaccharide biosynthesis tyrosine autokinase [Planctomycetota bacterium]
MGLKDYIRIIKRHKWWILGWVLLVTVAFVFYDSYIRPVRYSTTATFAVKDLISTEVEESDRRRSPQLTDNYDDVVQVASAPDFRSRKTSMFSDDVVIEAFKLYIEKAKKNPEHDTPGKFSLVQQPYPMFVSDSPSEDNNKEVFKRCLKVTIDTLNQKFIVSAHSTNMYKAQWMVDAFLRSYAIYEEKMAQQTVKKVLEQNYLRLEQRQSLLNEINDSKKIKLSKLFKQYGRHIVWEDGPERKQEERENTRESISETDKKILQVKSEIQEYKIFDPDRWLIDDGEGNKIVELQNELYTQREKLQQELASLRVDFTDKHPEVQKKLAQLNSLNIAFPKLAKDIVDRKLRSLQREFSNQESIKKRLLLDLERVETEIGIITEHQEMFAEFDRQEAKNIEDTTRLELYIERLQDKITSVSDPLTILTEPKIGVIENRDTNTKYYIVIFGLALGLGFAYILDYMDDTIRTPHDVEKFVGLRVIGTVPLLSKGEEKLLHRIALKSPISEMMNTLSMIIQSWMLKMKGQALLIVSSKPGEGKSTFITNLAVALCRGGEKVVLIDSDMRKPSLHRFFGVDNSVGFSNYLEDSFSDDVEDTDEAKIARIVHHTDVEGLFVIPSGPIPSNPVGLLKGENVERLLNHLKTYIGVILIDTPPLAMIDAGVLATKVNAVVTVMDAGKVTKKEALAGKHLIENVGGNSIGVILNKVTLEGEEYYYYFEGYSYYYGGSRNKKRKSV